jgi:hypothetical protein
MADEGPAKRRAAMIEARIRSETPGCKGVAFGIIVLVPKVVL